MKKTVLILILKSKMLLPRLNARQSSNYIHVRILLFIYIETCCYSPIKGQFFGTGSSRLEDEAQVLKDMAQEYKEIIEDKE